MTTHHDYASRHITIEFVAQRWVGPKHDYAETIDTHVFDVTPSVLRLPLEQLHYLTDDSIESDQLGCDYVDHDGPFLVRVTASLCNFFEVAHREDITQAMLDAARAAHCLSEDDTCWVRRSLTVACVSTAKLSAHAMAEIERAVNETVDRLGLSQTSEITHASKGKVAKPSAVERCDSDAAFEIAPPMTADVESAVLKAHADYAMTSLCERMAFAFDCAAGSISCEESAALAVQYVRSTDRATPLDLAAIRRLGMTARLCARDHLGWYPIDHARVDWPFLVRGWKKRDVAVRVWPVIDDGRERVRVAFMAEDAATEVYEVDFADAADKARVTHGIRQQGRSMRVGLPG